MAEHVGSPAGGGSINGMDAPQSAAGNDLLDFLVVLAIAMLMAHHSFGPGFVERLFDLQSFGAGHRHWFFKRNQFRAAFDANLNKGKPQVRQGAETK